MAGLWRARAVQDRMTAFGAYAVTPRHYPRYQAMTKVYSGTMRMGETTPSLDAGTPVSEQLPWEHIQEQDMWSSVENSFLGDIMQVPPMYSAIKVKGERLYTKARRGEEIVVPPRSVKVYDFQLKRSSQNRQKWDFYIVYSKGTYIRSLCADLALSLDSCAYLTALRREKIVSQLSSQQLLCAPLLNGLAPII